MSVWGMSVGINSPLAFISVSSTDLKGNSKQFIQARDFKADKPLQLIGQAQL